MTDPTLRPRKVDELLLDPRNPRLPEGVPVQRRAEEAQEELLNYFLKHEVLAELAFSFADNGFFRTEPVIATVEGAPHGHALVLEGNRRVAALKLLRSGQLRESLGITLDSAREKALESIPVIHVSRRDDATSMIGFRHIGGLRFWDADAKARWISAHVDAASKTTTTDAFEHVGRQVGLAVSAVRNAYISWAVIAHVRKEHKYDSSPLIANDRFGVWLRAMESPKIRQYIGLVDARSFAEVKKSINALDGARTLEVLRDILPPPAGSGIIGDSRNITKYADVVGSQAARKVLRRTEDLSSAYEALAPLTLLQNVRRAVNAIRKVRDELDRVTKPDAETIDAIRELQKAAKTLLSSMS